MKRTKLLMVWCFVLFILFACSSNKEEVTIEPITPNIDIPSKPEKRNKPISQIMTTEKKIALTFNGLAEETVMLDILNELDRLNIKATFFLDGMRVAEDPEIAQEVLDRGHTIQNNTLNHVLPDDLDYEEAYVELFLANKVIKEQLNIDTKYVRSRSGDSSKALEQAATTLGMDVITYTINVKDSDMKSAKEIADYVSRFATRGAIIELNTYINPEVIPSLKLIEKKLNEQGYSLTTLEDLQNDSYVENKEVKTNQLSVNKKKRKPNIIEQFETDEQEIVLTFSGWTDERTIDQVLHILDEYDVKATFFLVGKGIKSTPGLVRLISDYGHEVASNSYYYKQIPKMKSKKLQDDLIKNDKLLTRVLQEKPLNYFRPAHGKIDSKSAEIVANLGVDYIVLYDINSLDWDLSRSEDDVFNNIVNQIKGGSIINMHMIDDSHTVQVLPRIIKQLQQDGYSFRTVSEMIDDYYKGVEHNR